MIRETLRSAAYAVAPDYVVGKYLHYRMLSQARRLSELRDSGDDPAALVDALWGSHFFRPLQKKAEIFPLLEIIRALQPASICEIGAAGGGTTFLLAQAAASNAKIVTLDLAFTASRQIALECFASNGQKIVCIPKDSHSPDSVGVVKDCFGGANLDVLYLDGDHSYEGVKADFDLYAPLVRTGGVVVFHDIVPDFKTRHGIQTSADVGGVPEFWQEIKSSYPDTEEIVEDYEQDGYGIGVLHWSQAGTS